MKWRKNANSSAAYFSAGPASAATTITAVGFPLSAITTWPGARFGQRTDRVTVTIRGSARAFFMAPPFGAPSRGLYSPLRLTVKTFPYRT